MKFYGKVIDVKFQPLKKGISLREEFAKFEGQAVEIELKKAASRTLEQNAAFHGPIIEQVQAYFLETEGKYMDFERVKDWLKREFLTPKPQYYDDGSPVMVEVPHPERKGVTYDWHLHKIPGTSDLSKEEFTSFIQEILDDFLHKRSWAITIE